MKNTLAITAILATSASVATAGGLDRSGQQVRVLFEEGNRAEFSLGVVSPDLSGTIVAGPFTLASGDAAASDTLLGFGYKRDLNATTSFALIIDQPYGAAVDYPTGTNYAFQGATADVSSWAVTALARYKMDNFSIYGGPRIQTLKSQVGIPVAGTNAIGYNLDGDSTTGYGYTVGAAYEKPEIALRVALTYHSGIDHDQSITETSAVPGLSSLSTTTSFTTPQALNLDFQTGVAPDTLLFGSVRWAEWSAFEVRPQAYAAIAGATNPTDNSLLRYQDDRITYSIGLGRRFNDTWSGAITAEYEASTNEITTDLGPADGRSGVGLALTYKAGDMDITSGLRYNWIGDATSRSNASFTDNTALSFGVRIGMKI